MKVKEIWKDEDFEEMEWHDSHIHSISFSNNDLNMILDIDYQIEWVLNEENNRFRFWVSPAYLIFYRVLDLKISIDYKDMFGLNIMEIERSSITSKINNFIYYRFRIETDLGDISFTAHNFVQKIVQQPILSESLVLDRPEIII